MTTRIALLGANGQVGTEVSILLSGVPGVQVVPVVRTELGTAFLRRMGVDCVVGSPPDPAVVERVSECDVVADFTLPRGLHSEVRHHAEGNVWAALDSCRRGARYVFMSTTMAFGVPPNLDPYRSYLLARTAYAAEKRAAERAARRYGRKRGVEIFVFRLGQVHGALQRVSMRLARQLSEDRIVAVAAEPDWSTDVVFCTTIARALESVAANGDRPGTYTLVEEPAVTLADLYHFFGRRAARTPEVRWLGDPKAAPAGLGPIKGLLAVLARPSLVGTREFLTAQIVPRIESFEPRIRARHLVTSAGSQIASTPCFDPPPERYRRGPVPGPRLASLVGTTGAGDRGFDLLEARWRKAVGATHEVPPFLG